MHLFCVVGTPSKTSLTKHKRSWANKLQFLHESKQRWFPAFLHVHTNFHATKITRKCRNTTSKPNRNFLSSAGPFTLEFPAKISHRLFMTVPRLFPQWRRGDFQTLHGEGVCFSSISLSFSLLMSHVWALARGESVPSRSHITSPPPRNSRFYLRRGWNRVNLPGGRALVLVVDFRLRGLHFLHIETG